MVCSAANTTWYLGSSRTDSVNRGFCISLLTLAIVVLAGLTKLFLFFIIPYVDTDCRQNLFATAHVGDVCRSSLVTRRCEQ